MAFSRRVWQAMSMWVFLRDSHLSIVQHDSESRLLRVEARVRGDIERVFPEADVAENDIADYRFCAAIARERVAQAVALRIQQLTYSDFVQSVPDEEDDRREAYITVWARMAEEQTRLYPTDPPEDEPEEEEASPVSHRIEL
jgi:hypothetical protein